MSDDRSEKLPGTYRELMEQFPAVTAAHDRMANAVEQSGPLDAKTCALIKIGVSVGAGLESALRSHVRRAKQAGASEEEIVQSIFQGMNTVGFPRTVAAWSWARVQFCARQKRRGLLIRPLGVCQPMVWPASWQSLVASAQRGPQVLAPAQTCYISNLAFHPAHSSRSHPTMHLPKLALGRLLLCGTLALTTHPIAFAQSLEMELRYQQPTSQGATQFHRLTRAESWKPHETAVIICDMWDSHHCVNAVRRVAELVPRIDRFAQQLRSQGVSIIHAPSSCMDAYAKHPARLRSQSIPVAVSLPEDIASWCDQIPSEEAAAYPLDQSAGGEDDDPLDHAMWAERLTAVGRNPRSPWQAQCAAIHIDASRDYISDSGTEIWSVLEQAQIKNVILVGVHTNMCVLGRPFGLRRLASAGKNVVLARDLTDTMVDPNAWPYASHFTGTDLIVSHVERYVCPTISSSQVLGGKEFRFSGDQRPRLVMLIAEDEYETESTLPAFAAKHLSQHFSVSFAFGSKTTRDQIIGIEDLASADALLVSARRRALPAKDLQLVRAFVATGKPVIGIRTASHAFSLRNQEPEDGLAVWPEFDAEVFGGNYTNHYGNTLKSSVRITAEAQQHPIIQAAQPFEFEPAGSLYKTSPLLAGTRVLMEGMVAGEAAEPLAWTFVRNDGGRSFYTSLGHPDDFQSDAFETLLAAGIHWACGLRPHTLEQITQQNERYAAGSGRQRK